MNSAHVPVQEALHVELHVTVRAVVPPGVLVVNKMFLQHVKVNLTHLANSTQYWVRVVRVDHL